MMPIKRTEENNRDTRHDDSASRLESRKRHSHPFRARCPCPSITLLSRRQTRYPCWTPRTDLMPGLHLRTKRAIYAQRKENVSFAPGKKKHPAGARNNRTDNNAVRASVAKYVATKRRNFLTRSIIIVQYFTRKKIPPRLSIVATLLIFSIGNIENKFRTLYGIDRWTKMRESVISAE